MVDEWKVVFDLCDTAAVDASEVFDDECVELVSVYRSENLRERNEGKWAQNYDIC